MLLQKTNSKLLVKLVIDLILEKDGACLSHLCFLVAACKHFFYQLAIKSYDFKC